MRRKNRRQAYGGDLREDRESGILGCWGHSRWRAAAPAAGRTRCLIGLSHSLLGRLRGENREDARLPHYVSGLFVAWAWLDSAARVLHAGVAANREGPVKHRQLLRLTRGVLPRSSVPLSSLRSAGVVSSDRAFAAARLARRRRDRP